MPAGTTTVTSTVNILNKRVAPNTLGDVAPGCPSELRPIILDLASKRLQLLRDFAASLHTSGHGNNKDKLDQN
ncbi:hypothetical protein DPSP01_001211 [Paraphaeosphaeria sporulosa]